MNIVDLAILKKMVAGGGGSGTDNYNDLSNLPQINDETLAGNKTAANLGLQDALTFDSAPTEDSTNPVESGGVYTALAGKQDTLTFDGVYNASTNKAATESTVTNAINGLDVSALSVDADETISSISESDGKISVTKQDIAIVSNQVTAMTGYTKPSSAPATPAIQQDDTANTAFGKLEYKADTNQTNILYATEKGAKNILPITLDIIKDANWSATWNGNQTTINGITFTINPDGTILADGTLSSSAAVLRLFWNKPLNYVGVGNVLSGCPSGGGSSSAYQVLINRMDTFENIANDMGNGATIAQPSTSGNIYSYINITSSVTNKLFKPMVCTANVWAQSHEYVPYSLDNSSLTSLAIYNNVNGVKNLIDCEDSTGTRMVAVPCNLKAGKYVFSFGSLTGYSTTTQLIFMKADGTQIAIWVYCPHGNNVSTEAEIPEDFTVIRVLSGGTWDESAGQTVSFTNFMVCDPAVFNADSSYQPYAKSNSKLTSLEVEDRAALAEVVDSGSKNSFNPNAVTLENMTEGAASYSYQSDTTDSLTYFRFKLYAYQNSTAVRELYQVSPLSTGAFSCTFTKASDFNRVAIGHNGQTTSLRIFVDVSNLTDGKEYTLSLNVTAANPSVSLAWNDTMICTAKEWAISQKFVPYALPNSDLTYLEAEDRAALAEEIDAGAKNKAQTNTFTIDTDDGYLLGHKADLVAGQRYVVSYKTTAPNSGTLMLGLKNSSGTALLDFNVNNGVGYAEFTCPTGFSYYNVQATKAGTFSDFMICTKAAFDISSKFVPYRPNYDLVYEAINIVEIDPTVFFTPASGFTLNTASNATQIWKQGKHIFGYIAITKSVSDFEDDIVGHIAVAYAPKYQVNATCNFGKDRWSSAGYGIYFINKYDAADVSTRGVLQMRITEKSTQQEAATVGYAHIDYMLP